MNEEVGRLKTQPSLSTQRLLLRPFGESDADRLSELAGSRRIADTMISIPHPYTLRQAQNDILHFTEEFSNAAAAHFAITVPSSAGLLIGYIAVKHIDREHADAELSFWIAESQAGRGYTTEAGHDVLAYAFRELGLNRICAYHMVRNSASGKVLAKLGMQQEGHLRQRVRKWGKFEDVLLWAAVRHGTVTERVE